MPARTALWILALACLLPYGTARAEETKELAFIGVKWTLPDGFSFKEPTPQQKLSNYQAAAEDLAIPAQAYLVSETLRDRELKDIQTDVINVMRQGLFKTTTAIATGQSTLSGLSGFVVYGKGKIAGDHDCYAAAWGASKGGRFYVVLLVTYYNKHVDNWKKLDEARRGLRIAGTTGQDAPAEGPWPDLKAGDGNAGEGDTPEGPAPADDGGFPWPAKGPAWDEESRTISFPTHNLQWKLDADSPFTVRGAIEDETAESGRLIRLAAAVGEGTADVVLLSQERTNAQTPDEMVNDQSFRSWAAGILHERMPGGARIDTNVEVADQDAAFLLIRGKNEADQDMSAAYWVFTHGLRLYVVNSIIGGERGVERTVIPGIETLLKGLSMINDTEPVPGPIAGSVAPQYGERGKFQGKKAVLRAPNVELEKPAFMARLSPEAQTNVAFAAEGRSEDKTKYIYIDVTAFEMAALGEQRVEFEDLAKRRVASWKDAAGDSASVGDGRKPWKKARWARAKGIGWEFSGGLDGHPFVEHGYIVKEGTRAYLIRIQLGGEGAVEHFEDTLKDLEKNWDWVK